MDYKELHFTKDSLSGNFLKVLEEASLHSIRKIISNDELTESSLRRANLYFEYLGAVVCILERKDSYCILGEVLFAKEYSKKEKYVVREAALNVLFFQAKEKRKKLLGYYLSYPSFSVNFKAVALGLSLGMDLMEPNFGKGKNYNELRRAWNWYSAASDLSFQRIENSESEQTKELNDFYARFLRIKTWPKISYLCAKEGELAKTAQSEIFVLRRGNELLAALSGFYFERGESFYIDTFFSNQSNRRNMDILIGQSIRYLQEKNIKYLSFGLCPFSGEEAQERALFKKFFSWKLWYRPQGIFRFKTKYAKLGRSTYMLIEKKPSFLMQLIYLFRASIY